MRKNKIRFVFMIIVGIIISILLDFLMNTQQQAPGRFFDFLISITITILVWEGNLWIDDFMNLKFPWQKSSIKRLSIHLPVSLIYTTFAIYASMFLFNKYVCSFPEAMKNTFMLTALIVGGLVSVLLLSIEISMQFFINWKRSLVEIEKYKAESLQSQLQNLKNQLNPHFLFNNLSVLSSLVYKDQDKAVDFINQLSKVYRYLLDNRSIELVTLSNELTFIDSYTYLLKIRFGTNIIFNLNIPSSAMNLLLPPVSLQMLIENAIKHNEISSEFPLIVNVIVNDNMLEITNNLQLRSNREISSNTGLQNIRDRYKFFTDKAISVIENNTTFTVKIPLLITK